MSLRRGFKQEAEQIALDARREIGLGALDAFSPREFARKRGIPVVTLTDLQASGLSPTHLAALHGVEARSFAAVTFFFEDQRIIVENDIHSVGRRNNSVTHELSHAALGHVPAALTGLGGCRNLDPVIEDEATWLAGAMLVPRPLALHLAQQCIDLDTAAQELGVSSQLLRWRLNQTGAIIQAARVAAKQQRIAPKIALRQERSA